jgi:simple sugar transport system ATP-binding protein
VSALIETTSPAPVGEVVLEAAHVSKSFGPNRVLDDVSLTLRRGEVRCLAGENGSGKSTLIKIISGVLDRDVGEVRLLGDNLAAGAAQRAIDLGLCVIYQDLALFPNLTVLENIAFLRTVRGGDRVAHWREWRAVVARTMARMGVAIDLAARVETLSVAQKQLVAIARALAANARVIVMDEPTTALGHEDVQHLFALVRALRADGVSFIFVSHKIEEIFDICDTITVLRDGVVAASGGIDEFDPRHLALAMTGRLLGEERRAPPLAPEARTFLSVRGLRRRGAFDDISLDIREGEIVAVVGLRGSGQRELALALFGMVPADAGEIHILGEKVRLGNAQTALAHGIALLPEDRLSEGLFLERSIGDNIAAANMASYQRLFGWLDLGAQARAARGIMRDLRIRAPNIGVPVQRLSGGNQQRVVLARWIERSPRMVILNGPTVGIDIGSKQEIHELLLQLSRRGTAMLLFTDDLPEVAALSHRVLVMAAGRLIAAHDAAALDVKALAAEIAAGAGAP